jgi:hypothetical protein
MRVAGDATVVFHSAEVDGVPVSSSALIADSMLAQIY